MINLDQVKTLEWKVKQAVQLIGQLRKENDTLRGRLSDTEVRLQELEDLLESFKATQSELESGIRSALDELDNLEAEPSLKEPDLVPVVVEASEVPEVFVVPESPSLVPVSEVVDVAEFSEHEENAFEAEFAALVEAEETSVDVVVSDPEPAHKEESDEQPGLGIF